MENILRAGSAQVDISPKDSQFLLGYPHVERYSTGIHDQLWASSLYISDGDQEILFIANDLVDISKQSTANVRKAVSGKTGIKAENIMLTTTHTHSGPITVDYISTKADKIVPKADKNYLAFMEDSMIKSGIEAYQNAQPAKLGLAIADDTGVGTNRRDPAGPADHNVPVLLVKNADTDANVACMLVCSMHPTVMHEDSKLVSGDFPGLARIYLQENVLGKDCAVLHHMGPSGNQSPRHVTKANTFEEAQRLGEILGKAAEKVLPSIEFSNSLKLSAETKLINDLPRKSFPSVEEAKATLKDSIDKLEHLKTTNAPKQEIRTAECDWFGAEEVLTLAESAVDGSLEEAFLSCLPAEVQIFQIGDWNFIAWQGEIFVEYALEVKDKVKNSFVISSANGDLQGYIATKEAYDQGGYEASNALFGYETGEIFVNETIKLLEKM